MFEPTRFAVKTANARSTTSILNAVDKAMLNASVGELNLIKVSSILPKGISRVDELSGNKGEFIPAVISRAAGSSQELMAGLAWGFREGGGGGYVVEHSVKGREIQKEDFQHTLEKKLREMAEARDSILDDVKLEYSGMEVSEDEYGCVMSVLVYLP
ncbi:MAG: pyruvoyl-dependent arginine decarboxylase [Candidatus Thermoplasmatota archaeon]